MGEIIRELRKKRGLSQRALGERIGVSNRAVSKWESGLCRPALGSLAALARVLGVPMERLLPGGTPIGSPSSAIEGEPGMESLFELYRIGRGPSSSHTMGPERAALAFSQKHPDADSFLAILYGSLAKTGRGHGTDRVLVRTLAPKPCEVRFLTDAGVLPHENTMDLFAYHNGQELGHSRVMSVGGGRIVWEGDPTSVPPRVYPLSTFDGIAAVCRAEGLRLWQYAEAIEGDGLFPMLRAVWRAMCECIERGLGASGVLPGGLDVLRRARKLYSRTHIDETPETRENREVCAYAFAVGEENAAGGTVVTAPTCGAAGVLPAVLYYEQKKRGLGEERILRALATGGLVGNLIKTRASISGAECGCQAEIGSACAMAAAALGELFGLGLDEIEYAAEIAIEHHLGLTCDPIGGLVQIPCIERNAVAAMRAKNAVNLSSFLSDSRKLSLDQVIQTMKKTGRDIDPAYRETSEGGLARLGL